METIRELRQICQAPRKNADNWHMRHISRKPSIYITWTLLHTNLTANGATFLFLISGIIASITYIIGTKASFLAGSILLQFWYVMDMVDGEIARYRKQTSFTGLYFDAICHYIVHPFLFFCIGLGLYKMEGENLLILLLSVLAGYSIAMITVSQEVLRSVMYEKIKNLPYPSNCGDEKNPDKSRSIFSKGFSLLHALCAFPAVMNILLIVSAADFFTSYNLMSILIKFYAFAATVVWMARIGVFIVSKKIDRIKV